jgi:DNA polymerase-3 subunit gamma/tau
MAMLRMLAFAPAAAAGVDPVPVAAAGGEAGSPGGIGKAGSGAGVAPSAAGVGGLEAARAAIAAGRLPSAPSGRMPAEAPAGRPAAPAGPARAAFEAARAAAEKKKLSAEGWAGFIRQSGVTGMARMLAQHCELAGHETGARGDRIDLVLGDEHRHLLEKPYQDKLQQGLSTALGTPVELRVRTGAPVAATPIEREQQAAAERQRAAVEAIERDPFVHDLINAFDARLDTDAIRPSGEAAARDASPRSVASSSPTPSSSPHASESP